MAPSKMAARQNSGKTRTDKYQERDSSRRIRRSIKKLRAELEEIRAEVELIRRRQKHSKGKSLFQGDKAGMGRLRSTNMKLAEKTGPDSTAKKQRVPKLRKEEKTLQRMKAKAAEARAGSSRMREETAAMVEAMDDKMAELEFLRVLHIYLLNEMGLLSEIEEEGMEILFS